jgi:peroxiredoxin
MKFLILISLFCTQSVCFAQNTVILEIHAPKFKNGTKIQIIEQNFFRKPFKFFDLEIVNGKANRKIITGKGDRFFVRFNEQDLGIFLEPGIVKINIPDTTLADATITGSNTNQQIKQWLDDWKKDPIYDSTRYAQNKWFEQGSEGVTGLLKKKYDSLKVIYDQRYAIFTIKRIRANPASYINSDLLSYIMDLVPQKQISNLYEGLNKDVQDNRSGRFIKYTIDSLYINGTAPGFVQSDTSGNPVRLEDYRGKYLLLDFWASWCIPCRAENPNLIKAYEQFKDRNFEILAVSLDSDRKLWLDAIKKDKLPWIHISDLKGWDNRISGKYIIRAVPSNFLIGPDGKIIATNIRGKTLIETLKKVLP